MPPPKQGKQAKPATGTAAKEESERAVATTAPTPAPKLAADGTTTKSAPPSAAKQQQQQQQQPRRGLFARWQGLAAWIHWQLHIVWIAMHVALCNLICRRAYTRGVAADAEADLIAGDGQALRRHRKLVMVGDDVAYGMGDWVLLHDTAPPGLLRPLGPKPLKELFLRWHLFSFGRRGTGSRDWLPAGHPDLEVKGTATTTDKKTKGGKAYTAVPKTDDKPDTTTVNTKKKSKKQEELEAFAALPSLFEQAFDPTLGMHRDADVVILCVGGMDPASTDPEVTARRIVAMAEELERRGKRVIVAHPITTKHARDTLPAAKVERMRSRADAVDRAVRGRWPAQLRAETMVKLGPRIDFVLGSKYHWRFEGRCISAMGYKLWAKAWAEAVGLTMKADEARTYRALIHRAETRRALTSGVGGGGKLHRK